MCRAFPGSDYYEDSVTIGVSPRRPSRVPFDFGDGVLLVSTYIYQRSTAIKTALVFMFVAIVCTVVVILALLVFVQRLDRFGESWVVFALFSSWLLYYSFALFTGLVLAAVIVVGRRVLKVRGATRKGEVESRDQDRGD